MIECKEEKEPIGEGGNSKVYRIKFEPIMIGRKNVSQAVVKELKSSDVANYLEKYQALVRNNVPTLSFCTRASDFLDEYDIFHDAIFCEDLNENFPEKYYVTANSVRCGTGEFVERLAAYITGKEYEEHFDCKAEKYLLSHKFFEIDNFDSFVSSSFKILANFQRVALTEDSYFLGIKHQGSGVISIEDFVIADLDTVRELEEDDDLSDDVCYQLQLSFLTALKEFCKCFESDIENRKYYEKTKVIIQSLQQSS